MENTQGITIAKKITAELVSAGIDTQTRKIIIVDEPLTSVNDLKQVTPPTLPIVNKPTMVIEAPVVFTDYSNYKSGKERRRDRRAAERKSKKRNLWN